MTLGATSNAAVIAAETHESDRFIGVFSFVELYGAG
jgi:hypothetical protein